MSSPIETYDVFVSYAHADAVRVNRLVAALRARGLRVWFDASNIETFESITRAIAMGLANAKALVAFYSAVYPTRRACQWELTAAFLAAQHEGDPRRRVWALNPEDHVDHIEPIELRDELFMRVAPTDEKAIETAADAVANAVCKLSTNFGSIRPLEQPPWYGGKGLGSNRFVGRTHEFWRLHSALFARDVAVVNGQTAAGNAQVRGMGGVGKSLLVEEYALRFGAAYPGGVFRLGATERIDDQLYACAARLGIAVNGLDAFQLEGALERELRSNNKSYLWLVDDLPGGLSEDDRRRWFAPNALGKTVISTRSREYGSTGGIIDLGVLDARDAYELLTARRKPGNADEQSAAEALVAELGAHALAIDVAGGALSKLQAWSFEGFLARIRAPECDALDAAAAELRPDLPNGHDRSIARTLALTIDLIDDSGHDVLILASALAPDVIPIELVGAVLDQLGSNSSWGAAAVVEPVVNHCLADDAKQSNGQPGYRVHTLVQRTMRFQYALVDQRERIRALAVRALLKVLPVVADIRTHASVSGFLPHARHLVASLSTTEEAELGLWIAKYDQERGAFASAGAQGQAVLDAMRYLLGDEHDQTLTARNNLAATLKAQGELTAACGHQEAVLEARCRLLGDEHPDTLAARLNLAATLDALGDLAGARDHEEAVLEASGRLLGDEHPDTLRARNNLAQTLKAQGDLAGARGHEEAVLEARRRLLGDEHPDILAVLNNLAQTLKMQGDTAGARGHEEAVLEASRRLLGDEHPDTITVRTNLAATLLAQGDWAAASTHLETVLEASRRLLGDEHPHTLRARLNLARTLQARGDLARAHDHQQAVLEARRRLLGDKHSDTLTARLDLAATLYERGDFAWARGHQEEAVAALRRSMGEEHRNTLTARTNLAATLYSQGDLARARTHQEAVFDASCRLLGAEHPNTLTARNNLAQTLHAQGDREGARGHQEAVLEIMGRVLGDGHPDTIDARNNLAATLYAQGDIEGACGHVGAVLRARRRLLGDEHPDTLTAQRNLAQTLKALGHVAVDRQVAVLRANERGTTDNASRSARRVKIGRNQPCPCGSGKKYKRCCDDP